MLINIRALDAFFSVYKRQTTCVDETMNGFRKTQVLVFLYLLQLVSTIICSKKEEVTLRGDSTRKIMVTEISDAVGLSSIFEVLNYTEHDPHLPFFMTFENILGLQGLGNCGKPAYFAFVNFTSTYIILYICEVEVERPIVVFFFSSKTYQRNQALDICSNFTDWKHEERFGNCKATAFRECFNYRQNLKHGEITGYLFFFCITIFAVIVMINLGVKTFRNFLSKWTVVKQKVRELVRIVRLHTTRVCCLDDKLLSVKKRVAIKITFDCTQSNNQNVGGYPGV